MRNVHDALTSICDIENGLLRRKPTLVRWKEYHMGQY